MQDLECEAAFLAAVSTCAIHFFAKTVWLPYMMTLAYSKDLQRFLATQSGGRGSSKGLHLRNTFVFCI